MARNKNYMNDIKYKLDTMDARARAAIFGFAVVVVIIVVAFAAVAFTKGLRATDSDATKSNSDMVEESNSIVALSPDGPQFPSLAIDVPTVAPVPEYIRIGVEHPIVAKLQERLMELGFMDNDEPTEYYGSATESAVKVYQRQNGLAQDGIVGAASLESIMSPDAKYYAAKKGESGDDILRIQQRLYQLGYLATDSMVTGNFGDSTEAAVIKLQEINGLTQDGTVGRQTLNLIYSDEVKANMLAYGEKSEVVLAAQKRLFELGYMTSTPDGAYGDDTSIAIKAFQSKNDLVVDGYLGPGTRETLMSSSAKPNGLSLGDQSDMVINVQKMLAKLGYLSNSKVTGYFGEATESAVKAFQRRNSLSSDGSVGQMTMAKLTSDDAKKAAPNTSSSSGSSSSSGGSSSQSSGGSSAATTDPNGAAGNAAVYTGGGGVGTLLSVASSKLGSPYVWGAKGPNSFDCSGFVYWCLNNSGVSQSYITSSGWRSVGKYQRINSFHELQAGDIVVEPGHVGICAGGGTVIDASSSNGRVVQRSLSGWWESNFIVGWRIF